MSCNHPLHAFRTGRLTDKGKDEYFVASGDLDLLPLEVVMKKFNGPFNNAHVKRISTYSENGELLGYRSFLDEYLEIPCGHCIGCRLARSKEWVIRLCLEKAYYPDDSCYFLTLTYDPLHMPKDNQLRKKDLQDFWKRLRKSGQKFRYFACGEYGENTHRPHYHAIVFGLDIKDLQAYSLSDKLSQLYKSKTIQDIWSNGLVSIGFADSASIAYTAGYCEKKQVAIDGSKDFVKPFVIMSRKPAIGTFYYLDNKEAIISSNKVYGDFGSSHTGSVPRHFLRKLGDEDEMWYKGRSAVMQKRAIKARDIEHAVYVCSDDDYLGFLKDELLLDKLSKLERS